ncbi:hypothetical protein [Amycolatopsis thermoflava]|uniref:hypothetical protein n=1 Tax=Amycolatopsis thermoflava TaxID=84480 RepID=UPI0011CECDBC|nr:hypothetical protein [Amycolatopsis thermoflava]
MHKPEGDGMTTRPPTQGEVKCSSGHPGACPSGEDYLLIFFLRFAQERLTAPDGHLSTTPAPDA